MSLFYTPTWVLLTPLVLICAVAFFSSWFYRDTCDFKKSCRIYFPCSVMVVIGFLFAGLDIVLGIMMIGVGFVALMYFSNRIFYKHSNQ